MPTPMSLGRFLEEIWLPAIEPTVRATTFVNYRSHVLHQIGGRLGDLLLDHLDGPKLNLFYAQLAVDGRVDGKGGLSPASVRRIHATLHRALRDAVRWGYLTENPADRCDPPTFRADGFVEMKTWDAPRRGSRAPVDEEGAHLDPSVCMISATRTHAGHRQQQPQRIERIVRD